VTDLFETAAVKASGVSAGGLLGAALEGRADILAMTEQAHDAALIPVDPGGLSHKYRAALACRMAVLSQEGPLAAHFEALMTAADGAADVSKLADPAFDGGDDPRDRALLRHTDLTTTNPEAAIANDIDALLDAGVSEDDIVRLSELVAFVSYQIRLTIGLRLMGDAS
jgi:uncharacterized protein YciW